MRRVFCVVFLAGQLHSTYAQNLPSVDRVISAWAEGWKTVNSLQYSVRGTRTDANTTEFRLEWKESEDLLLYKYAAFDGNGTRTFAAEYSYDGTTSMRSFFNLDKIIVKKGAWGDIPEWIRNVEGVSTGFEFAFQSPEIKRWDAAPLALLRSNEFWKTLLSREIKLIGFEESGGRQFLRVEVHGATHRFIQGISTRYTVLLDPSNNFFPVEWQQHNERGELLSTMKVLKLQQAPVAAGGVMLPQSVSVDYFAFAANAVSKTPTTSWIFEFSQIGFESLPPEDYALDVSSANRIFDEDQAVFIKIPK